MKLIHAKGSPNALIWVVCERPYEKDAEKGFIFSSGLGYVFDKMMKEAGIEEYRVICRANDLEDKFSFSIVENELNHFKPPIIIALGDSGKYFCPQLASKSHKGQEEKTELDKYAGSLLSSKLLKYPHYIIPTYAPEKIVQDWSMRDIVTSLDLSKAKEEAEYYKKIGNLRPLPVRDLKFSLSFNETIAYLKYFSNSKLLSVDIESMYTNMRSKFYPHPGYPVTIGIANSPQLGISFNFFWDSPEQNIMLWRELDKLLSNVQVLGQNFFIFDLPRLNAIGLDIKADNVTDTMVRHHILWPELPHKLQFMTRQYTREPYYKDEGKQWSGKDMTSLRRYNCLDVCVTYEVYLEQEKEFNERPYLI